jgi:hypothetical protein
VFVGLARKANCPVLPIKIVDDGIIIGKPINVVDDATDTGELAVKIMKDLYTL